MTRPREPGAAGTARRLGGLAGLAGLVTLWTAPAALAQTDGVTIRARYVVVMDRLRPDPREGVRTSYTVDLRLSGARRVDESWRSRSGRVSRDRQAVKQLGEADEEGGGGWRVLPGNKIQRRIEHRQSVTTMTITVDNGDRCRLEIASALKPGFSEYLFRRRTTGEIAYFTNRRATDLDCEVVK